MDFDPVYFIYLLGGYLVGSVSSAIITCKLMGLDDPRRVGSNNPGATNVLRHGGKKAAIITLLGDMLKGLLPVLLVRWLEPQAAAIALAGAGAFLGHLYPLYFGFKGGKGVATFYGVLLGFDWLAGLLALALWLLAAAIWRISSLSALISTLCSPFIVWAVTASLPLLVATVIMAILIYWKHRTNIRDLIAGREETFVVKKPESDN